MKLTLGLKLILILVFMQVNVKTTSGQSRRATVVSVVDGDSVFQLLQPDDIPAIRQPEFLSGAAGDAQMSADEPVLGLTRDSEQKAYSLWQLDHHEIVNDFIGETPVAVTW